MQCIVGEHNLWTQHIKSLLTFRLSMPSHYRRLSMMTSLKEDVNKTRKRNGLPSIELTGKCCQRVVSLYNYFGHVFVWPNGKSI